MGYYLFFAVGMLVFGPLSDKYGRKPLLVVGMVLYSIGSVSWRAGPLHRGAHRGCASSRRSAQAP